MNTRFREILIVVGLLVIISTAFGGTAVASTDAGVQSSSNTPVNSNSYTSSIATDTPTVVDNSALLDQQSNQNVDSYEAESQTNESVDSTFWGTEELSIEIIEVSQSTVAPDESVDVTIEYETEETIWGGDIINAIEYAQDRSWRSDRVISSNYNLQFLNPSPQTETHTLSYTELSTDEDWNKHGDSTIELYAQTTDGFEDEENLAGESEPVEIEVVENPTATFSWDPDDRDPNPGETFLVDGISSTPGDEDGFIKEYAWDFTDNGEFDERGSSTVRGYSFDKSGFYDITLQVTDNNGKTDTTTRTIRINKEPKAAFEYSPEDPIVEPDRLHTSVFFDASESVDPDFDGEITDYEWTFNAPGHYFEKNGETVEVDLTDRTYDVTLTVTDEDFGTDSTTQTVEVDQRSPPEADAGSSYSVSEGESVDLDASDSSADSDIVDTDWELIEGSGEISGNVYTAPVPIDSDASATVELKVTDEFGETDTDTATVTISSDADPDADAGGPYSVEEDGSIELDAGNSIAPDGTITDTDWEVSSGSGYVSGGTYYAPSSIDGDESATIELTVTDSNDATDTDTTTVSITALEPPNADAGGPYSVQKDESTELDASGSTAPDGSIVNTEWEVIDGQGSIIGDTYTAPSLISGDESATIELTVTDNNDATDTDTATISITALEPPEADAGGPYSVEEDGSIELDAGNSIAPDGTITDTDWEISSGSGYVSGGTYYAPSSIDGDESATIELTVTDSNDATDTDTATVSITALEQEENALITGNIRETDGSSVPNVEDVRITISSDDLGVIVDDVRVEEFNTLANDNDFIDAAGFNEADEAYTLNVPTVEGQSAYTIEAELQGFTPFAGQEEVFAGETSTQDIRLEAQTETGELTGDVIDEGNQNVPGATVELLVREAGSGDEYVTPSESTVADLLPQAVVDNNARITGPNGFYVYINLPTEGVDYRIETTDLAFEEEQTVTGFTEIGASEFSPGTNTADIVVDLIDGEPFFEAEIIETNAPIEPGETLTVDIEVENTGGTGETFIDLFVDSSLETWQSVSLDSGEVTLVTLEYETESSDTPAIDVEVAPFDEGTTDEMTISVADDNEESDSNANVATEEVAPTGSTVTIETNGAASVSITNIEGEVSNIEGGAKTDRGILFSDFGGLPETVSFDLIPPEEAETVTFNLDGESIVLDVSTDEFADKEFNNEQYTAVFGTDGDQTQNELSTAINEWFSSEDNTVNGVEMSQNDLSALINYWFNNL